MIKYVMGALLSLLMVSCQPAMATTSLLFGGSSYHIGADTYEYQGVTKKLNEVNPMVGVEHNGFSGFVMKNSYYKTGVGITYTPRYELTDWVSVGVRLGAVTGYSNTPVDKALMPIFSPELDLHWDEYHVALGLLPSGTGDSKGIITLNFKWTILP